MTRQKLLGVTLAALFVAACGGSSPDTAGLVTPAGQAVIVATSPAEADIPPGGKFQFASQVSGTAFTEVAWSVAEADGGTIDATGLYTAPAIEGTYHVRANSKIASVTSFGTSVVRVKKGAVAPAVAISISPTTATLDACRGQVFNATVTNSTNTAVTWTVVEAGGGTVTGGAYVAPAAEGTYRVMAVSQANPTRTATATVTVGPERVLSVAVNPGSGTVYTNGTLPLAALVTTTCGTFAAQ